MKKIILVVTTLLVVACAHHRDVRPGDNGLNRVIVTTDDKEAGSRDAISQANHYCKEQNRAAVFMDEKQNYTGNMDEGSYKAAKTAAKVAGMAGGSVWALGGEKESNIGGIVGMGGAVGDSALGKAYTVDMTFKCN